MKADGSNRDHPNPERSDRKTTPPGTGGEPLPHLLADAIDSLGARDDAAPWTATLTPADRDRLVAALGRRGGRASLDHSLTADLVEAVLPEPLAALVEGPQARRRLAERIAGTLLDDPVAAARLQTLVAALASGGAGPGRTPAGGPPP